MKGFCFEWMSHDRLRFIHLSRLVAYIVLLNEQIHGVAKAFCTNHNPCKELMLTDAYEPLRPPTYIKPAACFKQFNGLQAFYDAQGKQYMTRFMTASGLGN